MNEGPVYVAVCGGGAAGHEEQRLAEEVGRLLAREGAVVVCGGLGGVMESVAKGAAEVGGVSIGILPGRDRTEQASDLTYSIPTGFGEGRNVLVVRAADAVIAIGGEFGTLSEIALALKLDTPVVGLRTWELAKGGAPVDAIPTTTTAEDAVAIALESARGQSNQD